jgi:hypothetical protein
LIVVGGLYFASMLLLNRQVLETEPGESDALWTTPSDVVAVKGLSLCG